MALNLLLKAQLQRFVGKLFSQIFTYNVCSTARNVVAKEVSLSDFVLKAGAKIDIKFTDVSSENPSSGNITLNVNNTGAKTVKISSTDEVCDYTMAEFFCNNVTYSFVFDGTYWIALIDKKDLNTLITKNEFQEFI